VRIAGSLTQHSLKNVSYADAAFLNYCYVLVGISHFYPEFFTGVYKKGRKWKYMVALGILVECATTSVEEYRWFGKCTETSQSIC